MRTTVDIPEPLIEEARQLLGFKSKTDTIVGLAPGVDSAQTHRPVESDDGTREAGDRPSEVASPFTLVIFVDTSVWVETLRSREGPAAQHLVELLDSGEVALSAPVRIEILAGASNADVVPLRRVLSALPLFFRLTRRGSELMTGSSAHGPRESTSVSPTS